MRPLGAKAWTCAVLISLGFLSALPNVLPQPLAGALPGWYTSNTVTLGLDLRGGSHLLLEVDTSELAGERALQFAERVAAELETGRIAHRSPEAAGSEYRIVLADARQIPQAVSIARELGRESGPSSFSVDVEGAALLLGPSDAYVENLASDAVERSLEIVRQRLDATGVVEPSVARQGDDAIIVQLPGVDDPARVRELLGTTAKLTFHLVAPGGGHRTDLLRLPGVLPSEQYRLERRAALEGEHLSDARVAFDEVTSGSVVHFQLDREGARRFAEITRANVGRALAIVLDDRVISAPVIRGAIPGGAGEISGAFTVAEAADLALLLRAGALPAPLHVIEERTVGPDLGSDAIDMGLTAGLIGAALVIACMFVLYGRWGLIANTALVLNAVLIFGALSLLGATLTLPGIAGIVLAIGMAVDANILINERIREETRRGLRPMAALDAGFKRAFGTILDSSLTTLIATSLLFMFGSGPVRGFAVTIAIGLTTSMFTAVAVTRLLMEWRVRRRGRAPLVIGGLDLGGRIGRTIPFMRARLLGLASSALLSVGALVLLVEPGLHRGVDFAGGTVIEVRAGAGVTVDELRNGLAGRGLADAAIQQFGGPGDFLIRAPVAMAGEGDAGGAVIEQVKAAVQAVSEEATFPRVEMVGPKVSQSFAETAILAVLLAGIGMLGYLWLRFEWPFAVAAIATLTLDLTKMLGVFALFGIEFNLTAIAALLTLIGYSVNDKVVVFDRIRENLRLYPGMPLHALFDQSITATLTRTVFTSATTFLAILPMALAGGAAVASFALPMLVGIVLGTSSSIFIAAPMVLLLAQRYFRQRGLFQEGDENGLESGRKRMIAPGAGPGQPTAR
jgi:SecD/SecF fusion protein